MLSRVTNYRLRNRFWKMRIMIMYSKKASIDTETKSNGKVPETIAGSVVHLTEYFTILESF